MRHSLRWPRITPCLAVVTIALALVTAGAPAQAAPTRSQNLSTDASTPVQLRDGVIVDPSRGVAYVMTREGRVDALRTSDGAVLWSSSEAAKPLLVTSDLLIAQGEASAPGELSIVTLGRDTGRVVSQAGVALPEDVWATVSDRPRATFRAAAVRRGDDVMVLWRSSRLGDEGFQGYVPSPDEGRAPGPTPGGALATRSEVPRLPEVRQGAAMLEPRSGAVHAVSTKAREDEAATEAATLRAFDGLTGVEGRKFLSADGRHVLVSRVRDDRDGDDLLERYEWSVYTRGGERLGAVSSHRSAAPFLVSGSLLLFEASPIVVRRGEETIDQPLQVVAVDLATGVKAWSEPIRQVDFAGPFPP